MRPVTRISLGVAAIVLAAVGGACGDYTDPDGERLEFETEVIDLASGRSASVEIRNSGNRAVGPIQLVAGPVTGPGGSPASDVQVTVTPNTVATLNPGAAVLVALSVDVPGCSAAGGYRTGLNAAVAGVTQASASVQFDVAEAATEIATVTFSPSPNAARQGDVVAFTAEARSAGGDVVANACVTWTVSPEAAAFVSPRGRFVGYTPGMVTVTAAAGDAQSAGDLTISARGLSGGFTVVGQGVQRDRYNSDLWLHPSAAVAYTGTWGGKSDGGGGVVFGNTLYVWDLSDPAAPQLADSVEVEARTVNDVKVSPDGTRAVLTHENSNDLQNGVTLLDLSDPLHPDVIVRFTSTLQTGVHNAWIDDDYVYLVVDGISAASGLRVLDISDPMNTTIADEFYAGSSFLHDVYVRDGMAFLSHWDAGLVILDVGNGMAGGSPENVVEVSRVQTAGGQTHNAWYWPAAGYVFVGEEDFGTPGIMHVVDVRNLTAPREVATFSVPGSTPHNFWLDESNQILYLSWYANGIRALDVSGELLGELDRQGREIVGFQYAGASSSCTAGNIESSGTTTCNWAPQLRSGLLHLADMYSGIWVLDPDF